MSDVSFSSWNGYALRVQVNLGDCTFKTLPASDVYATEAEAQAAADGRNGGAA